jgi:K+-transporting ATPase ATPase B chain
MSLEVPPTRRTPETDEGKELTAARKAGAGSIFAGPLVRAAIRESFIKVNPMVVARNPVMFVVEVGAAITTIVLLQQMFTRTGNVGFTLQITLWLWFTVLFANVAEAMAEARGKAQADTLRATKKETPARRVHEGSKPWSRRRSYARAIWCSCARVRSFLATARSSKASRM